MGSETAGSSIQKGIGVVIPTHQFPVRTFGIRESLICSECPISCPTALVDHSFCMDTSLDMNGGWKDDSVTKTITSRGDDSISMARIPKATESPGEYTDEDVLHRFGPSRLPPRVAYRIDATRKAIETEITDLLATKTGVAPAMMGINLNDPRFRHLPRVQSTMIVKRKAVNRYKGDSA